jgi:hypothetical protein
MNSLREWFSNPRPVTTVPTYVPQPEPEDDAYIPVPGRSDQDNHEHAFRAIAVQAGMRMPMQPPTSIVLYGCKICSLVKDQLIQGNWTLEQVTELHRQEGAA